MTRGAVAGEVTRMIFQSVGLGPSKAGPRSANTARKKNKKRGALAAFFFHFSLCTPAN